MKITNYQNFSRLAVLGTILISANVAFAQGVVETRTTSVGTVREFSPGVFTVTTQASTTPVRYTSTKTTTYVDENGNPVSVETVRSGLPVTVYYDRDGDNLVASKVVVRKQVDVSSDGTRTTQTTSTSTAGTVSQYSSDGIAVTTTASPTPVRYTFSKTTTYVDENGNPVSVDVVKSGAPVTVFYDYQNGTPVASKVVVQRSATTDSSSGAVETKKTTTTTTTTDPNQ